MMINPFENIGNVYWDSNSVITPKEFMEFTYFKSVFREFSKIEGYNSPYNFHIYVNQEATSYPENGGDPNKDVLIWIGEERGVFPDHLIGRYKAIFKCHLRQEVKSECVFPLPLGFPAIEKSLEVKDISLRKYDVFFSGNLNNNRVQLFVALLPWPLCHLLKNKKLARYAVNRFTKHFWIRFFHWMPSKLKDNSFINFTAAFGSGLNQEEYNQTLRDAKIVLSPKGFYSTECFRTYEALRYGCIVISEPLPKNDFYTGIPVVEIGDWSQLLEKVRILKKNPDEMKIKSEQSLKWYRDYLSPEATAKYILKKLSE